MKRRILFVIIAILVMTTALAGCSGSDKNQDIGDTPPAAADTDELITETQNNEIEIEVDIDLTVLSTTMIYAEVQNMMTTPEQFLGKTIKMSGKYNPLYYDVTDTNYHYVLIPDATACCAQGLEFIWTGDHTYPNDYPVDQTDIEIVGVFKSYQELESTYYYIETDAISILA